MPFESVSLRSLPDHEVACLAALALTGRESTTSRVCEILGLADVRFPGKANSGTRRSQGDYAPSHERVKKVLESAAHSGWVDQLSSGGWRARPSAAHASLMEARERKGLLDRVYNSSRSPHDYGVDTSVAALRHSLYTGDAALLRKQLEGVLSGGRNKAEGERDILRLLPVQSPAAAFDLLPEDLRDIYLPHLLDWAIENAAPLDPALSRSIERTEEPLSTRLYVRFSILRTLLGEPDIQVLDVLRSRDPDLTQEALAFHALWEGDVDGARNAIGQATAMDKRRRWESPLAPLWVLVLATGDASAQVRAREIAGSWPKYLKSQGAYAVVAAFLARSNNHRSRAFDWQTCLILLLVDVWTGSSWSAPLKGELEGAWGYAPWISRQLQAAERRLRGIEDTADGFALVDLFRSKPEWERTLDAVELDIAAHAPSSTPSDSESSTERLVWRVEVNDRHHHAVFEPRLQKRKGKGWTSGRPIALKRLAEGPAPWLSPEDHAVVATLKMHVEVYYGRQVTYYFTDETPVAMIGHPRVVWASDPRQSVEVVAGEILLRVDPVPAGFRVYLEPPVDSSRASHCVMSDGRIVVYPVKGILRKLAATIPPKGLDVPKAGQRRLEALLERLAPHARIAGQASLGTAAKEVAGDPRPVVELRRSKDGLQVRLGVRPLGPAGPRFDAGVGTSSAMANIDGVLLRAARDLEREAALVTWLEQECPRLAGAKSSHSSEIDDPRDSLELISDLQRLGNEIVVLWPDGAPMEVVGRAESQDLRLALRASASEWFAVEGEVALDEDAVVDLQVLLDALPGRRGRFVPIDADRFAALSDALLARLHALSGAREATGDDEALRLPAVGAGLVASWGPELGALTLDKRAQRRLAKAKAASTLDVLEPRTLEAELRDYQREGYRWLCRLAHWGAGACLADDMGLGKTVQALAVLVARAELGPSLVVAPTSVVPNWAAEAVRFAPTLEMIVLTQAPEPTLLESLASFQVVVTSYGLLATHADAFAGIEFATLIADEAQAIKNPSTQRAKALFQLRCGFRVAMTGTPVENRLSELWSLMRFLNPGLLGPLKTFEQRFARPIQRDPGGEEMQQLRRVVAPFVLRRNKREVLRELPAKTEVLIRVEPSLEEASFSEALRRNALERFHESGASIEESAMVFLAELTKLRLAACHPELVDPAIGINSEKLEKLIELLQELRDGGHRALVFSQFVTFLKMVKPRLEAAELSYAYLDGAVSTSQRKAAVTQFQSGSVDVFLISLKAGGTGLNLTAADYVIHLDPWWNPAVEDQASDRAHRLGQTRPVTVYRLITRGSVEERVMSLHAEKRDLAERILDGTHTAKAPDAATLYDLLSRA